MKPSAALALALLLPLPLAAEAGWTVGEIPDWVRPIEPVYRDASGGDRGIVVGLLENQVHAERGEEFTRISYRVDSDAALEDAARLDLEYDPFYQEVVFHHVRLIRNGSVSDQLSDGFFKTLHRETGLEENLLDGSLTLHGTVHDLRKGDIVEFAYTVKGKNPLFDDRFSDRFHTSYDFPCGRLYFRLLASPGRKLSMRFSKETYPLERKPAGELEEWILDTTSGAVIIMEDRVPSGYNPYGNVFLTQWKSWEEVAIWAASLFALEYDGSGEIGKIADGIRSKETAPLPRIGEALRFVQDQVRYYGVELGTGSYRPRSPDETLRTRFGDCKDKTMLLIAILDACGIHADPVLVNTYRAGKIADDLPSPFSFNHVIARVELGPSEVYYLDPTITLQGGAISFFSLPYERGLVIAPETKGLFDFPGLSLSQPVEEKEETYESSGTDSPVKYTVRYTFRYARSDWARSYYSQNGRDMLRDLLVKELLEDNRSLVPEGEMGWEDDRDNGVSVVTLAFTWPGAWEEDEKQKRLGFTVGSSAVDHLLTLPPENSPRTMPWALPYPEWTKNTIIVRLHDDWPEMKQKTDHVSSPWFEVWNRQFLSSRMYSLTVEYRSFGGEVEPRKIAEYAKKVKEAQKNLSQYFSTPVPSSEAPEKTDDVSPLSRTIGFVAAEIIMLFSILWGLSLDK